MNRTAEHNNRIGRAKVAPGMATRSADGHLKAAAAERFRNDGVGACAIEHHASLNRILPLGIGKNATHAPQIAFALFPHVADEQKRSSMRKIEICKRRFLVSKPLERVTNFWSCRQTGHLLRDRRSRFGSSARNRRHGISDILQPSAPEYTSGKI